MDIIQDSGKFSDAEIRRLNYCRLFLRAETCKLTGTWSLHSSRHHGNAIYHERPEGAV